MSSDAKVWAKTCEVCGASFEGTGPAARYCSAVCHRRLVNERDRKRYGNNPRAFVSKVQKARANRVARRWSIILAVLGNECGRCKQAYPIAVYDLHHPEGKRNRRETPSNIIASASETEFLRHLATWELLCANCHRIHHAENGWNTHLTSKTANCKVCGEVVVSVANRPPVTCSAGCEAVWRKAKTDGISTDYRRVDISAT